MDRSERRQILKTLPLTIEEKARWEPMLHKTWSDIAPDAEPFLSKRGRKAEIVELVVDANRVQMFGGMTDEEYAFLSAIYSKPTTQRWLKSVLNY